MRRVIAATAIGVGLAAAFVPSADAKFGMSKTRVTLKRLRPPEVLLLGETASIEMITHSRRIPDRHLDRIRGHVQEALRAGQGVRLVEDHGDSTVQITVDELDARINDNVTYEDKYVQTGTKQEWNDKKKKYETKAVYGYRREPVRIRTVRGRLDASVRVRTPAGEGHGDASVSYENEFKGEVKIPSEASSESQLEDYLVEGSGFKAAGVVAYTPDPVEAMLAVDGELKDGNRLAENGLWKEALALWNGRPLKGDKEAARLHNMGVAHEAIAFSHPPDSAEHQAELEQASDFFRKALALDPGEKYFAEPIQRVQSSLDYAATSRRQAADFQRWREEATRRRAETPPPAEEKARTTSRPGPGSNSAPPPPSRKNAPGTTPPVPARTPPTPPPVQTGLGASASLALPLRNGSFESSLAPWTSTGKGAVVDSGSRGKVWQAASTGAAVTVAQAVSVDVSGTSAATLNLDYKVSSGEGRVRVLVTYDDAQGRPRTSSLEITAGDPAGDWTPWTSDLAALRPRPARVKEVKISVEGGTVLVDNVALNVR
jgi:hypothetical protein